MDYAKVERLTQAIVVYALGGPGSGPREGEPHPHSGGGGGEKIDHKGIAKSLRQRADNVEKAGLSPKNARAFRDAADAHDRLAKLDPEGVVRGPNL